MIAELRKAGYDKPIYLHGALMRLCELYQEMGIQLGDIRPVLGVPKDALKGQIVLAPPSALSDRWSRRLGDVLPCAASGWMQIRARAKQRLVELPLVISDHADWDELTRTMTETGAEEIWVTHGREEALVIMRKDAVSRRRRSRFWGMKKTKANKAAAQGQLSSIIGATDS